MPTGISGDWWWPATWIGVWLRWSMVVSINIWHHLNVLKLLNKVNTARLKWFTALFNHPTLVTINFFPCNIHVYGMWGAGFICLSLSIFFNEMVSFSQSDTRLYWSTFAGVLYSCIRCKDKNITFVSIDGI